MGLRGRHGRRRPPPAARGAGGAFRRATGGAAPGNLTQEKAMVRQRNVPNFAKNCRLQRKSGSDASTEVHMPLKTGEPISEKVATMRSLVVP